MNSITHNSNQRRAATTAETLVATVLLGVAIGIVGRFTVSVNQGLRDRELSVRLGWEISNAREQIGSWSLDRITEEEIDKIPVSEIVRSQLRNAKWQSEVSTIDQPAEAIQVTLALVGEYRGQVATPERLTFWVEKEPSRELSAERRSADEESSND